MVIALLCFTNLLFLTTTAVIGDFQQDAKFSRMQRNETKLLLKHDTIVVVNTAT